MPTLRWAQGSALPDRKFRWANGSADGTATTPKFRWAQGSATGSAKLVLAPIADVTVEAFDSVTVQAQVGGTSPTPSGYVWRQISGPTVSYSLGGDSIVFTAPTAMAGATVVFGVTAVLGAQSSAESTATVNVLPHLYWIAGTSSWQALTRPVAA